MAREQLTDHDREALSETPLLRVDQSSYSIQYVLLAITLIPLLIGPSLGPKTKPPDWEPPKTLDEYFSRLWPYAILWLLLTLPPLADTIIRWAELKIGTKQVKKLKVARKLRFGKWTLITFHPFHLSLFKYFWRLRSVEPGEILITEMSAMNRIIDFEKEN